jgi:RNA polymerase nonessential primary-like sigma factor
MSRGRLGLSEMGGDVDEVTNAGKGRPADSSPSDDPVAWIEGALAYVPAVARRFTATGVSFDELLAAGNLGLVEAALRFDPSRKVKFVTYADWWIRKTILKAIQEQTGPVRLPRYRLEQLRDLHETRFRLTERLGREPDTDEIARAIDRPVGEVRFLLAMGRRAVSIDQSASGEETRPMVSVLADDPDKGPQSTLIRRDFKRHVRRLVDDLDTRERRVLMLRFGLVSRSPMTLRQVGRELGISRERVRQIEHRALRQLRDLL